MGAGGAVFMEHVARGSFAALHFARHACLWVFGEHSRAHCAGILEDDLSDARRAFVCSVNTAVHIVRARLCVR